MEQFADTELAARIERLGAGSQRGFVEAYHRRFPELDAAMVEIGGGVAAYLEHGSPINGMVGMGFEGEVDPGELAALEYFFREREERAVIALAPLADVSLLRLLGERQWTPSAFENVLVRALDPADEFEPAPAGVEIRAAETPEERELWAALVVNGFAAPLDPSPAELHLGQAMAAFPDEILLIGYVDGAPAGTGELHLEDGIGWLSADTTLPEFRRRGMQGAMQRARLAIARDAGCELAVTESMPGSASQRNMERVGFSVAYTRVEAMAPEHHHLERKSI